MSEGVEYLGPGLVSRSVRVEYTGPDWSVQGGVEYPGPDWSVRVREWGIWALIGQYERGGSAH